MYSRLNSTLLSKHARYVAQQYNKGALRRVHAETRLKELGLKLPEQGKPKAAFVNMVVVDNIAYLSGHLPQPAEGPVMVGKLGKDWTVEQGYEASKICGLNLLSTLKHNLGDLDKVKRVIKLTGFVNCIDTFSQQPAVINGCSELMLKVYGAAKGTHTRSALGTNALPFNVGVEIEGIFELEKGAELINQVDYSASAAAAAAAASAEKK